MYLEDQLFKLEDEVRALKECIRVLASKLKLTEHTKECQENRDKAIISILDISYANFSYFTSSQLSMLLEHEKNNKNRKTVINKIEKELVKNNNQYKSSIPLVCTCDYGIFEQL